MFGWGRKTREEEERRLQARKKEREQERLDLLRRRFEQAKGDEHATTRIYIDMRHDQMIDWLNEFDRRVAAEIRQHARTLAGLLYAVIAILLFQSWR